MSTPDQGIKSPAELRDFSIIQHGLRGFSVSNADEPIEGDVEEYGIDWDAMHNSQIAAHHAEHNSADILSNNPFATNFPEEHNMVEVQEPNCPFSQVQLNYLHQRLAALSFGNSMELRRDLWVFAFSVCRNELQW